MKSIKLIKTTSFYRKAHNQILVCLVRWFSFLFPSAHESSPWNDTILDLREMYLDHHTLLSHLRITYFRYTIPRSPYFQEHLSLHVILGWSNHQLCILHVPCCTTSKVGLMLFPLSVSEIGTLIRMEGKTKTAF